MSRGTELLIDCTVMGRRLGQCEGFDNVDGETMTIVMGLQPDPAIPQLAGYSGDCLLDAEWGTLARCGDDGEEVDKIDLVPVLALLPRTLEPCT